jgi:serine/threonine-protein kinase SRPK3
LAAFQWLFPLGGYHPVKPDDVFNKRYVVLNKLGWGHFSTVWLTWDVILKRYVALKIVKSDRVYTETARDEIKLLSAVKRCDNKVPGKAAIVELYDHFVHQGTNGNRKFCRLLCLATSLLCVLSVIICLDSFFSIFGNAQPPPHSLIAAYCDLAR